MKKYNILFFSKETSGGPMTFYRQISNLEKIGFKTKFYIFKNEKKETSKKNLKNCILTGTSLLPIDLHKIYKIISAEKPDLIFTSNFYTSIIIYFLKKAFFKNIPWVCMINNNLIEISRNNFFYKFLLGLMKPAINSSDKTVFVSKGLSDIFSKKLNILKEKTILIYNSVNIGEINILSKKPVDKNFKKHMLSKNFKIFTVARLERQKDLQTLLKAFKLATGKFNNIELFIIGDGKLKNQLKGFSKLLKIDKKVYFLGWITNIFPYLKNADLFISSSKYEGFGRTLIEAMALGLPIISTNAPFGPSEILSNGKYGILVSVGDEKKISEEIQNLIKNNKLRQKYSKLSSERAKNFELKEGLKKYENLFKSLIINR